MRFVRIVIRLPFVVVLNTLAFVRWCIAAGFHRLVRLFPAPDQYVRIKLEDGLPLGRDRRGIAGYFDRTPTFLQLRRDLKRVGQDKRIRGIVIEPRGASLGRVRSKDFAVLLDGVRESGKEIVASFDMAMTPDYVLATSADRVVVTPAGRLYTFGSRIEQFYFTPLLEKLGVTAQFVHIGAFKTAYNRFVRDQPSPADHAMTSALRTGIDSLTVREICHRRSVDEDTVRELFRSAPVDARWAKQRGLVDAEAFERDLPSLLENGPEHVHKPLNRGKVPVITDLGTYIDSLPKRPRYRSLAGGEKTIAVIDLSGMIVMPQTNIPGANQTIDPDDVLPVLKAIEHSAHYDGLLVHINSPGGSALASDIIWHAIDEVRANIPVVAYCSEVAGSGGYYLACGADQIVCRPESIVGSIGVITGKLSGDGVLEHLGVNRVVYDDEKAPAKMLSLTEPFNEADLESVKAEAREFYRRFLQRVGVARGIPKRRLHRYARGRVYLGEEALHRGLVDSVGGFDDALERLEALMEAGDRRVRIKFVGIGRQSLADAIRSQLVPSLQSSAQDLLGSKTVKAFTDPVTVVRLLEREHTLALSDIDLGSI